ncbi:Translocation protein sec66 [Scedosporium apiospermum]|uniref:Translocation protein sec66 n=1 Tax=Pseudallescheria apiosperma TaxID=563466 RepID=A0A084GAP9_PSEDA|nr:Translocation protein sec66 [Scedosporium apiospermum]KEZ44411.1 Translocation protein sec66 [Scedosporium apiospermum]
MLGIEIDWVGLVLPFAYLIVLSGSLMTFSSIYRKRKATQAANLEPWFGPHLQRNIYLSLLHMEPENGDEKSEKKIPDNVLKAALLRRAVEDINRLVQIRTAKQAITSLLQKGSVGDDLWQRFQRAEKEMENELRDVVMEANGLAPNWGQFIFQSANEIAVNVQFRKRLEEIQGKVASEKEWWEKRRATLETELLNDEEAEKSSTGKPSSEDSAVLVDPGTPSATPAATPAKAPAASTTPAATPAATPAKAPTGNSTPATGTPSKKKRGKK